MANNFAKKTGIISKLSKYIPNYGEQISKMAELYGYGFLAMVMQVDHSTMVEVF